MPSTLDDLGFAEEKQDLSDIGFVAEPSTSTENQSSLADLGFAPEESQAPPVESHSTAAVLPSGITLPTGKIVTKAQPPKADSPETQALQYLMSKGVNVGTIAQLKQIDQLTGNYRTALELTTDPIKQQRLREAYQARVKQLGSGMTNEQIEEAPLLSPEFIDKYLLKSAENSVVGMLEGYPLAKGFKKETANVISGMTTPQNLALAAWATVAPELVGSYFAVESVKAMPEVARQAGANWDKMTPEEKGQAAARLLFTAAIPAAVALHTGADIRTGLKEAVKPPVLRSPEQMSSFDRWINDVSNIAPKTAEALKANLSDLAAKPSAEPIAPAPATDLTGQPTPTVAEAETKGVEQNATPEVATRLQTAIKQRGIVNADVADQSGIGKPEGYQEAALGGQRLYVPSETAGGGVHGVIDQQGQFHAFDESTGTIEAPAQPKPKASKIVQFPVEKPDDLIQHLLDSGVTILSKKGGGDGSLGYYSETYKQAIKDPILRKLFRSEGGDAPDVIAEDLRRSGRLKPDASVDDLWSRLLAEANSRRAVRKGASAEKAQIKNAESDQIDFEKTASGERLKNIPTEAIATNDLLIGDKFELDGEKVMVKDLEFDDGDELQAVVLEDGWRFGTKRVGPNEAIHVDKGTLQEKQVEFAPPEAKATPPKLRPMEDQGDLLSGQQEDFALSAEKGIDYGRKAQEKAASEAAKAESEKKQREIIGMGGAVPSEFAPSGQGPTSIKNARVDVERANRGLPPAIQPARRSFGHVWDEAMGLIDRDPDAQQRLLNELRENPRALTDQEDALLLHRQIDLQNEYAKATRDLAQAYDDGRMDAVGDEKARVASLSDQLLDLYNIGKKVGTETGRGLNARKMLANEDFTLATMEVQKRAANNGRPLNEQQSKEVQELNKKIEDTQKAYDDYVAKTNERIAALEADRLIAEAKANASPQFHPGILKIAEEIVAKLEKSDMVKAARERLKGRLLSPSPQDIADLAVIGATHIARGALELAKFTEKMVGEFGENIRPYIQEIHDKAKDIYDKFSEAEAKGQGPAVKRALNAKATIEERIEDATTDLNASFEKQDKEAIHSQVNRIVRAMVEREPNIPRETLIDRVHEILKMLDPEMTRLETMDAISGRGIFSLPAQDKISKTVRDLKQQVRLVGHQQDVIAKKPLPRTGPQRDSMSDAARHEQQKLNELKRQYGVVVTDPKKQLASALNARKTYYTHRIADLKAEIEKRERITKSRTAPPTDPALEALRAEYKRLKDEHNKIFGDRTLSDEQRLKLAEQAAKRSEEEWTKRLENAKTGKFGPTKEARPKLTSVAIEAIRARVEAIKEQVKELQDLANPKKTPEEIALQSLKTRLKNRTAELLEKTARGDFSVKPRKPVVLDPEATRLHYENAQAKASWYEGLIKDRLKNRSVPAKIIGTGAEILNTQRAIVTSLDLSAVLRQGGFIAFAHPIRALQAFPAMFRALRSAAGQHAVNQELMLRPNFQLYRHSKLYLSLPEAGQTLAKMEEAYMSRWADKIPLVAGSQRAYVTFLNKLRADSFDAMAGSLSRDGTLTPEEAKAVSNFINVATGRGNLGMKENALVGLNTVFFAPRYVASRFQLLAGQPFYRGTGVTRLAVAKEYARFLAGVAVIYGLAQLDGAKVEQDPRSSDFGKLRYGNTRIDPMAGLIQTTVLIDRLASGETKTAKGKVVPIRGPKVPFGSPNAADVIARFMRSKLAPAPGAVVDLLTGKNVVGEPVTMGSEAANIVVPLTASDIFKTMQEQGIPRGTAFALLSIFGMGLQNYDERKRTTR